MSDAERRRQLRLKPRTRTTRTPTRQTTSRTGQVNSLAGLKELNTTGRAGNLDRSSNEFYRGVGDVIRSRPNPYRPTQPTSPGGGSIGRRSGYGGGGGGAGIDPKVGARKQIDFLKQLMASSAMDPRLREYKRDEGLYQRLADAQAADNRIVTSSYDALDRWLSRNQVNAYADAPRASAPAVVEENLAGLLASAGVDGGALEAEAGLLSAGAEEDVQAYDRLLSTLGAAEQSAIDSRGAESAMARAYAANQVGAQGTAARTAIDLREAERQRAIEEANFAETSRARQVRMQMASEVASIAAQFGLDIPTLAEMGLI